MVIQTSADGTPKGTWTSTQLKTSDPFAKDASFLHLLGMDGSGALWFDIAVPTETPQAPEPPAPSAEGTEGVPPSIPVAPSVTLEDWPTYLKGGTDRVYRWEPQAKSLKRFAWSTLTVPPGFARPTDGTKLFPPAGALLLEKGPTAWLVPFSALPFAEPSTTLPPITPGS